VNAIAKDQRECRDGEGRHGKEHKAADEYNLPVVPFEYWPPCGSRLELAMLDWVYIG
jgi:hypothetical protein